MTDLGTLGGSDSVGRAINETGQVVGALHTIRGHVQPRRDDATIQVVVNGDRTREADEVLYVNLSSSSGAFIADDQSQK